MASRIFSARRVSYGSPRSLPASLIRRISSAEVEDRYVELVEEVRAEISVPLAVKLSPWFTALGNLAMRLQVAGADGLVLFNRLYQPDIDLDTLTVVPRLAGMEGVAAEIVA